MSEMLPNSTLEIIGMVLIATISAASAIQVALINTTRKHAKATHEQTANDHVEDPAKVSNLRDNIDLNQETITRKLNRMLAIQRVQGTVLKELFGIVTDHTSQIEEITEERWKVDQYNSDLQQHKNEHGGNEHGYAESDT